MVTPRDIHFAKEKMRSRWLPEFPWWKFGDVATLFEHFPHVLPNDASTVITVLKIAYEPRLFILRGFKADPRIPHYEKFWEYAKNYPESENWNREALIYAIETLGWNTDIEDYDKLIQYLWEPAKKLAKLLTGYIPEQFKEDLRFNRISHFSLWEPRASRYLNETTDLKLDPGREVTNQIKRATLRVTPQPYKRLLTVEKTVTYG